jgi:ABC-2 type transport system ATP-binding protein
MRHPLLELRVDDGTRTVEALRGVPEVLEAGLYGRHVHVVARDLEAAETALTARLAAHGIVLRGMEPIPPSLEDVFVALVSEAGGAPID